MPNDLTTSLAKFLGSLVGREVGPMYQSSVTLTNAQVLTLPTTPVAIVAATETLSYTTNPVVLPIVIQGHFALTVAGAYTNVTATTSRLSLYYGADQSSAAAIVTEWAGETTLTPLKLDGIFDTASGSPKCGCFLPSPSVGLGAFLLDNGLYVSATNTGNFTGGNAGNSLKVSVAYMLWNRTLGVFV